MAVPEIKDPTTTHLRPTYVVGSAGTPGPDYYPFRGSRVGVADSRGTPSDKADPTTRYRVAVWLWAAAAICVPIGWAVFCYLVPVGVR